MSAAFSATATTTAHGWPDTCVGKTEASTQRSPAMPCTRREGSTTLSSGDLPIRAEETYTWMACIMPNMVNWHGVGQEWKTIVSVRRVSNARHKRGGRETYRGPCWHGSATQHLLNLAIGDLCTAGAGAGASLSVLVSASPQAGMFWVMAHPIGVGHARPPWARRVDVIRLQIELRGYRIRVGDTEKEAHPTDEHVHVALCRQIATQVVRYQRERRSQGC